MRVRVRDGVRVRVRARGLEALPRAEGGGVEGGEVRDVEGGQQRLA